MILVLVGTQKHPFPRLLKRINEISENEKVIVQYGHNQVELAPWIEQVDWLTATEIESLVTRADVVITHGGVGSIMLALKHEKKILAMPRLEKYHEHVNDHQTDIVSKFVTNNYLKTIDERDINIQIEQIKMAQLAKYPFDNSKLIDELSKNL